MTFKRNGGILFISALGCSVTFARKGRRAALHLPRNPVARVRALMVVEESRQNEIASLRVATLGAFVAGSVTFAAALIGA